MTLPALVHCVPNVGHEASGPTYSIVRLCEALIVQGEPTLLATVDATEAVEDKSFVRAFPVGTGPARLARSPAMKAWLYRMAVEGRVRLIHSHSLWKMPNVYPGWAARRYRLPLVVSPRGTLSAWAMTSGSGLKKVFWPLVQRPAIAAASAFHATSAGEYCDIRRAGFLQPVFVIPNGIDSPPLATAPAPMRLHRTLLFLGRIHPIKGLDQLLGAWRAVQDRFGEWHLRIVGPDDGGYLATLRETVRRDGLRRVEFAAPAFGASKWEEFRAAELFVLPSRSENFGMAAAEALASGRPVIATHGTPWDGLPASGAGWWVEGTVEGLVACMQSVLALPKEALLSMGARGRDWMHRQFAWPAIAAEMAACYRWLEEGGSVPSSVRID